jgi:hypothetical protein
VVSDDVLWCVIHQIGALLRPLSARCRSRRPRESTASGIAVKEPLRNHVEVVAVQTPSDVEASVIPLARDELSVAAKERSSKRRQLAVSPADHHAAPHAVQPPDDRLLIALGTIGLDIDFQSRSQRR